MIEIVWQYDPESRDAPTITATAAEGQQQLEAGNAAFADLPARNGGAGRQRISLSAADLGIGEHPGQAPAQTPFAAVLSCADARVPTELLFGRAANDMFVVRVAGNVLGSDCIGSIEYAIDNLTTLRQLVVLGHTGCGAVDAAVTAYLHPHAYLDMAVLPALRTIVDSLMATVRSADLTLQRAYGAAIATHPGYTAVLRDLAVCLNAALGAHLLARWFGPRLGPTLGITYGVYNLVTRQVGLPASEPGATWAPGLTPPPAADPQFVALAASLAQSLWVREQLDQG